MTENGQLEVLTRAMASFAISQKLIGLGHFEWTADPETYTWSEGMHQVLGVSLDTPPSREVYLGLIHPDDRQQTLDRIIAITQGAAHEYDYDVRIIRPDDGRVRHLRAVGMIDRDETGAACRVIGVYQDITRQKDAEQAQVAAEQDLARTRRLQALSRLAGGMAHDFNNLLTIIISSASLVSETLADGVPAQEDIDCIIDTAREAGRLTERLLAFAAKPIGAETPCRPARVLSSAGGALKRIAEPNRVLTLDIEGTDVAVGMTTERLMQVVTHLVANARQATGPGGRIVVSLSTGDEAVLITVEDDGPGMAADVRRHAFDPFFTTLAHEGHSGLGLSTCHGIVQSVGGHMHLGSAAMGGARVEVHLRAMSPDAVAVGTHPACGSQRTGRLLLVEDNDTLRTTTARLLRGAGHTVVELGDPARALSTVRSGAHAIDAVISDVVMPGLTGPELARALWTDRPDLPVLFMSGHPRDALSSLASDMAVPMLCKPFDPVTLHARVQRLLATVKR